MIPGHDVERESTTPLRGLLLHLVEERPRDTPAPGPRIDEESHEVGEGGHHSGPLQNDPNRVTYPRGEGSVAHHPLLENRHPREVSLLKSEKASRILTRQVHRVPVEVAHPKEHFPEFTKVVVAARSNIHRPRLEGSEFDGPLLRARERREVPVTTRGGL